MPMIIFLDADGSRTSVEAASGVTVMRAALENGIEGIMADCAGSLNCATCHIYIADEWASAFAPPTAMERDMLECAMETRPTSRLSCQLAIDASAEGAVIEIPRSQY